MKKNIIKADIIDTIAKATGITKTDTKAVVDAFLIAVIDAIANDNRIEIRGFGVFQTKKRKARIARNPKTGELVQLKERLMPMFKTSGEFTKKVNEKHSLNTKNNLIKSK